jgi:signal transduction histidine kinase/AmiR/NasT family two-component response regulator
MSTELPVTFKSTWWELVLPTWLPDKFRTTHLGPFLIVVWGISMGLSLLSFFITNPLAQASLQMTALAYLLLSGAAIVGLPVGVAVHIGLVISSLHILNEALHTGGVFSVALAWTPLLPLLPLFAIGALHSVVWFVLSLLMYFGVWWATYQGWFPQHFATNLSVHIYSGLSYTLNCLIVLGLPLLSERVFQNNLARTHAREQELLKLRADLLRSQNFKNSFISTLSHELRTPLNAILGFNDLLVGSLKNNPQALSLVKLSHQAGEHLLTVINDVLDFSQMQMGHLNINPEPFELRTTVTSAFKLFEQKVDSMDITYHLQVDDDVPATIVTDRHRLTQILVNLLGNAIKFTHKGSVSLRVRREHAALLFEVQDTGIGVASDRVEKIFERFEQANVQTASLYGGNGLGLSICHQLVQRLGGTIGVQSQLGKGSRFWVRLPLQEAPATTPEQTSFNTTTHLDNIPLRFLIVDDNPVNRLLACSIVQSQWPQAYLCQASNGAEALTCLREEVFDLVLMDMVMPEMDGIEATQHIRQDLDVPMQHVPVILLTANVNAQDHLRSLQAGINALLVKPFDRLKLVALIEEQLLSSSSFLKRLSDERRLS